MARQAKNSRAIARPEDKAFSLAKKSILDSMTESFFTAYDYDRQTFSNILTYLVCGIVADASSKRKIDARSKRAAYKESWAEDTGMDWKELGDFAVRIEGIASDIGRVNDSSLLAFDSHANQSFRDLPDMMRTWASALLVRMNHIAGIGGPYPRGWTALDILQWHVEQGTGKPNDKLVADFCNAAAIALGHESNAIFSEPMLAQRRARRRKRRTNSSAT